MTTYSVSINTFGTHPSGKSLKVITGLSEKQARIEADFLNTVEKLQLHDNVCWSISIFVESK